MYALIRILAAALAAGLLIKLLSRLRPHVDDVKYTDRITVTVTGSGSGARIEVDPRVAHVRFGTPILWEHTANKLIIVPKRKHGRPWPFNNGQPEGDNGAPAESGPMKDDAMPGVRHSYGIIAHTSSGNVREDPDIIIHM